MTLGSSWRATAWVARFEVLRAVRTWRAAALVVVFLIANLGGTWLFLQGLLQVEQQLATTLGVATTDRPGALLAAMQGSEQVLEMLTVLTGSEETAEKVAGEPILALFQLWLGVVTLPFLGATTSAETISGDVRTRAIRYEALRTGRGELVVGRFLGQVVLAAGALALSLVAVWGLGLTGMASQDPWALAWALGVWGGRAALIAFPFVGVGMMVSQWTASPMWSRVLALGLTAASWMVYGWVSWVEGPGWVTLADALAPLLPQTWIAGLWSGGWDLVVSGVACTALGLGAVALGFVRFAGRDL